MSSIESTGNLTHHRLDTGIGMIGGSGPGSVPNRSVESFQTAGRTQVSEVPVWMFTLDEEDGLCITICRRCRLRISTRYETAENISHIILGKITVYTVGDA